MYGASLGFADPSLEPHTFVPFFTYADFEQLVGGVETLFGTRGAKDANEYGKMVGLSGKEAEKAFSRVTAAQEMVLDKLKAKGFLADE